MQKKPHDYYETIEGVVLRRSDLRAMTEILMSRDGASVTFESDTHTFETLDELIAHREPVKIIRLRRRHERRYPFIVEVRADETSINAPEIDDTDRGAVARLTELFRLRRRWYRFGFKGARFAFGFVVPLTLVVFGEMAWKVTHLRVLEIVPWLAAVVVWLLSGSNLLFFEKRLSFRPEPGETEPINWRGASWEIFKIILAGIVGAAITLLVKK